MARCREYMTNARGDSGYCQRPRGHRGAHYYGKQHQGVRGPKRRHPTHPSNWW